MINLYTDGSLEYTGSLEHLFLEWQDHGGTYDQTGYTEDEFLRFLAEDGRVEFGGGAAPVFTVERIGKGI